jgi:hypothetical protein
VLRQRPEPALTVLSLPRSLQTAAAKLRVARLSLGPSRPDQEGWRFVAFEQVVVGELVVPSLLGKRSSI